MIVIKDIKKVYDLGKTQVQALKGINLTIENGEFLTISGSSGSGKSTLLNMMGCLDQPTSGEIWFEEKNIMKMKERELNRFRLEEIGYIFQSFNLIPALNVYENIELPLLIMKNISAKERRERVEYFIEMVGLKDRMKNKSYELSGGQRQRVAVARALSTHPSVVLADEPTANLDSKTGIEIINLMHDISRKELTTFIFSTHDPKVMKRADRIIKLEDGAIVNEGKREE